jgi:hypothetical protein
MSHVNSDKHIGTRGAAGLWRFFEIPPILDSLSSKSQNVYMPEKELTTDKAACTL